MNEDYIVTIYYVIDEMLKAVEYQDDGRSSISASEVLTVAIVAARYFHNHWERALCILIQRGDITPISVSRFNRRLHRLYDWLYGMVVSLGELFAGGEVYIIDSMPLPVCKRIRASRCRKVRGKAYCGYCSAKKEKFLGWRPWHYEGKRKMSQNRPEADRVGVARGLAESNRPMDQIVSTLIPTAK